MFFVAYNVKRNCLTMKRFTNLRHIENAHGFTADDGTRVGSSEDNHP